MTAMVTAIVFVNAEVARIPEAGGADRRAPRGQRGLLSDRNDRPDRDDQVANHDQIAEVVADKLNKVLGVVSTETHIAFRAYSAHDLEAAFSLGG